MITRTLRVSMRAVAVVSIAIGCAPEAVVADILVYDHNTEHHLAAIAATNIDPAAVIANSSTFNNLLNSQAWDAVLIDCPSTTPAGGWQPTIDYVNGGGKVAMSFWDWGNQVTGHPNLVAAFGGTAAISTFSLNGLTLSDSGASSIFDGVTVPNSDWHDHWVDDGDGFSFTLASGSVGLANLSGVSGPVIMQSNGGRTIAAFVIDEAGNTWLNNGSGVRLWENMLSSLVPEPMSAWLLAFAGCALFAGRLSRRQARA